MKSVFFILRHVLMITAIIGSLYISHYDSYVVFTFLSLLYIALDRLHAFLPQRVQWLLHFIKIGYIIWFSYNFEGILYILIFSSLFTLFPLKKVKTGAILAVLYALTMNLSILPSSLEEIILANIAFCVITSSLFLVRHASKQKEEIQYLYDILRRNHYEIDEARQRVMEYAKKVEKAAQIEERNRISKDLHDELGHKLIRAKMMMEAIIKVMPVQYDKGMAMLHSVRDHLSESMESLRMTVRRMKPDDETLRRYSLKQLIENFAKDSGVSVEFDISGLPSALYPSEEVALYRNAQEAMTNAVRHGKATEVAIHLDYQPHQVVMSISNNGNLPNADYDKGLGIKGMEERIELLGGYIIIQTEDRYTITTVLPHKSIIA